MQGKEKLNKLSTAVFKHRLLLLSFTFFILFSAWVRVFAAPLYTAPGPLDPGCLPTDSTCTVGLIPTLTTGSIAFSNGTELSENNSKLFWDNSGSGKLYIGTNSGTTTGILHVEGTTYIKATESSPAFFVVSDSGGRGFIMSALTNNNGGIAPTSYGVQINVQEGATTVNTLSSYSNLNTGTTANLYINAANVGIGDTTPAALFTVGNGDLFQVNSSGAIASAVGITSAGATISLNTNSNFTTNINGGTSAGTVLIGGGSATVAIDTTTWDINSGGIMTGFTGINSTGLVKFSDLPLNVTGVGDKYTCVKVSGELSTATGAGAGTCGVSSRRFKHDIETLSTPAQLLEEVNQFRPVSFRYNHNNEKDIGFIAEEINTIDPSLVAYEPDGTIHGLFYEKFTIPIVGAIQALDLNIKGLSSLSLSSSNSMGSLIKKFLADAGNTITDLFVDTVHAKKLCLDDVCLTKDQLKHLLDSQNIPQASVTALPASNGANIPVLPQ